MMKMMNILSLSHIAAVGHKWQEVLQSFWCGCMMLGGESSSNRAGVRQHTTSGLRRGAVDLPRSH